MMTPMLLMLVTNDDRNGGKDVHAGDDGDKEDGELKNI